MVEAPPLRKPRQRRAADLTAQRLGRAILGYLVAVTLIITLAPFRFAGAPVHGLTDVWNWPDLAMNVAMFVPIGFVFQLTRPAGSAVRWHRVLVLGASLSGIIELAQLFAATRYSSLFDLATNTAGALLGAGLCMVALQRIEGRSAVRTLALELPLMGLVYLLVPLTWLVGLASAGSGPGSGRAWLVLPIVAFASGILGTVYAAYLEPARRLPRAWLLGAALGWCTIALLPGTIRDRELLLTVVAVSIGIAWLRSLATGRLRERHASRRFEIPTLRLVMPLFAAYLALSSLWPLDAADVTWHGMIALIPALDASQTDIFVALEHVAAFTLVGYVVAEYHGRDLDHFRQIAACVACWGGGLSVLLELARGFHPAYHASALMVLFTTSAAVLGGWLYQLQRDHVRALLARRTAWTIAEPMRETNMAPTADAVGAMDEIMDDLMPVAATSNDPAEPALSGP